MTMGSSFDKLNSSISDTGVIEKWFNKKDHLYIKTSRYLTESRTYGTESIMECIAYELGVLLNINVVPYWLDTHVNSKGEEILVCVSKDYRLSVNVTSRISARRLFAKLGLLKPELKKERYNKLIDSYPSIRNDIDKMIVFDYIIANTDRHLNNFEFYVTDKEEVKLAPLFDNGSSLLADWYHDSDLLDLKEDEDLFNEHIKYAETYSKSFSNQHCNEIRLIDKHVFHTINLNMTESQIEGVLIKYKDLLSPLRLEMVATLVKERYKNILKIAS